MNTYTVSPIQSQPFRHEPLWFLTVDCHEMELDDFRALCDALELVARDTYPDFAGRSVIVQVGIDELGPWSPDDFRDVVEEQYVDKFCRRMAPV